MILVDSHCHLDGPEFAGDLDAVLDRAQAAGVAYLMAIGTGDGPAQCRVALELAERFPQIYATAGIHPHHASLADGNALSRLEETLAHPRIVALGEIGLDYHYDFSPRDTQRGVFADQLRLAASASRPVVIHTREAWDDTLALLARHGNPARGGVFHCFSGGPDQAREALDMGFHLGLGGVLTFPKAEPLREAARLAPLDRLLVETDAPYLAPVPFRGRRNEPAFVLHTARRLAELRGETLEAVAVATTRNWLKLTGLDALAAGGLP